MIAKSAIIDADFALKIGKTQQIKAIQDIVPELIGLLFVHEHVYNNEILFPASVKGEIDKLICQRRAQVVSRKNVADEGNTNLLVYDETVTLLESVIDETMPGKKNWGEIVSIAYARSMGISFFLSDESALQGILNEYVNSGNNDPKDIHIIRILDFISWMKKADLERKVALVVWVASGKPKDYFQKEIWPAK
jgi:hypothetical protein